MFVTRVLGQRFPEDSDAGLCLRSRTGGNQACPERTLGPSRPGRSGSWNLPGCLLDFRRGQSRKAEDQRSTENAPWPAGGLRSGTPEIFMEANWPMIALLAFVTCIAAYIGRVWFKRWFNPLTIYSAVWGFCLVAYELRLIQYYDLSGRAWALIVAAWASLYLGALLAVLFTAE